MWNSHVHRAFPGRFESSNVSRDDVSGEIGRTLVMLVGMMLVGDWAYLSGEIVMLVGMMLVGRMLVGRYTYSYVCIYIYMYISIYVCVYIYIYI